nr:MAG: GNAT family N-acetyltransferase [Chloroflexota bacterium]
MLLETIHGPVTLRPTRAGDAAALRDLRLDALRTNPEAYGQTYEVAAARPAESWEDWARRGAGGPTGVTYVADAGGQLVAMASLVRPEAQKFRHAASIQAVYVRPARRGAGLAGQLIEACAEWARAEGLRVLRLTVVTTNTAAIRCYARHGFAVYGLEREALFHEGVFYDELLMARWLV